MVEQPAPSRNPIAYVRIQRGDGEVERHGYVFCTRQGASVSTSECARCPQFVKVTPGLQEDDAEVHCVGPAPGLCENLDDAVPLTVRRLRVSALMTRNVVSVRPDLSLDAVSALFLETGLKAVPVIDRDGGLLGFISEPEVMLAIHVTRSGGRAERPPIVGDVLLSFAVALPETASVTQAAAVMAFEGQQRVAIVSASGALVGILSASDVMYWLARSDGHVLPQKVR
jgi:CBS domain-containing protein